MVRKKLRQIALGVKVPVGLNAQYRECAYARDESYTGFVQQAIRMRLAALQMEQDGRRVPAPLVPFLANADDDQGCVQKETPDPSRVTSRAAAVIPAYCIEVQTSGDTSGRRAARLRP